MNDNYDYIKLIEKIRAEKDMDELANLFMNIIIIGIRKNMNAKYQKELTTSLLNIMIHIITST